MAHPSNAFPSNIHAIIAASADVNATPKHDGYFHTITCSIAGGILVRGGGIYEYVDVTDATDVHQNYIDPSTGAAFVNDTLMNSAGDGYYESINSRDVTLTMVVGQTIYGRFDSIKGDGTFTGFAYS